MDKSEVFEFKLMPKRRYRTMTMPSAANPELTLLIYDRKLERVSLKFAKFSRRYKYRYAVNSGEKLKALDQFPKHAQALMHVAAGIPARRLTVLAAGGGSVGDFAAFFASVYKRGVGLVHMPTTWLAAIDSSHGGKSALNVGRVKNQIGTFYPGSAVVLDRDILFAQPAARAHEAMGELAKIAMIDGGAWVRWLEGSTLTGSELIWKFLKHAVDAKMKVVRRDPRELKGSRQILNLGHTMAHVLELHHGVSHGESVTQGLFFALEYSHASKFLSDAQFERAMSLMGHLGLAPKIPKTKISGALLRSLLLQDKKRDRSDEITFIFLRRFGACERRSISVSALVREAKRQGWAK